MKNKTLSITPFCRRRAWGIGLSVAFLLLTSCHTPYQMGEVSRTRILIDKRYDATPPAEALSFLAPYRHQVDSIMSPQVGTAARYLFADRPESPLSNLLPDILMWASTQFNENPDLAVYNVGGMRAALAEGKVTVSDVVDVAPFENKICFLTLTGQKLTELFRQIAHRGGEGVSHGVVMQITPDGKLLSVQVNGKDIDAQARYRIVTIDYLSQGNDEMTAFKSATGIVSPQDAQNNVRNYIMDYFREKMRQGQSVDCSVEGRITVVNP
jgi:2',3'-cyclic-nucleotide 2'-phosphodiesterase (5'-nucleotidase family)